MEDPPDITLTTLMTQLRLLEQTIQHHLSASPRAVSGATVGQDAPAASLPSPAGNGIPPPAGVPAARPLSRAERRRREAVEQDVLTERGWREGYDVMKCSRWMSRYWPDLLFLNFALSRLEANSFTLLGGTAAFSGQARAFYQKLADYRACTVALAHEAKRLAGGRFPAEDTRPPDAPPSPDAETTAFSGPTRAESRALGAQEHR
jgi:hypothetical protein